MALTSWVSELFTVHAESATTVAETPSNTESVSSKPDEAADDDEAEEEPEEQAEAEEEEEEEEEEEPEDEMPAIREQCEQSKACAPLKHHFDECQERVMKASEDDKHHGHEDCTEEMFHLMHCVDECSANKVFAKLK